MSDILDSLKKHLKEEAEKIHMSLNFGELPDKEKFAEFFEIEVVDQGSDKYPYNLKGEDAEAAERADVPTEGEFTSDELYEIVKKLSDDLADDEAASLASAILGTIGIEWI